MMIDSCSYAPFGAVVRSSYNVSSICDFLEEIACHKTFSAHFLRKSPATNFFGPFPQEIACHKTFSAHFLRKSPATKLFRLISSGNRLPQTFRLISSGNRPPHNFFSSFPQEIACHKLFRLISSGNRWDGLPLISSGNRRMAYIELTL